MAVEEKGEGGPVANNSSEPPQTTPQKAQLEKPPIEVGVLFFY